MKKTKKNKNRSAFYPLVSIVIPVYNGSNYVKEAIDSALAQTYKNIEVIVINDGSSDDTDKIARSYGDKIRYFDKENGGVATALNLAIEKSRGEYISWLSHDDVYYFDKIEKQIRVLSSLEEKNTILYSDFSILTLFKNQKKIINKKISSRCISSLKCLLAIDLNNTLNGCTMLMPKNIFYKFGFFDVDLRYTQDYHMWFNLLKNNVPFLYIKDFLVYSRQHDSQGGKANPEKATVESDQIHSDMIKDLSNDEVDIYCKSSADFLINIYNTYNVSGYKKTAYQLLKHITRISSNQKNNEFLKLLNTSIFNFPNTSDLENIFENQIKKCLLEKKKSRVLVYSNVWTMGGLERVVSILMNNLADSYDWILVSTDKDFEKNFSLDTRINHIRISENNQENIAQRLSALSVLLNIDLFIGNPNIDINFLDVYKLLYDLKIKTIACNHYHFFLPYHYAWLNPVAQKRMEAYKYVNAATWLTSFSVNAYKQTMSNGVHMPNPISYEGHYHAKDKKKEKIILCVGRFYDSVKRLDRMLLVFKKVIKMCPDAKLVLVGDFDSEKVLPGIIDMSIRDFMENHCIPPENIFFEGEKENVKEYYEKASLLMLTSDSEGFPMILPEAGFFGLPAVIFEVSGLEDVIIDGENGFIVPQDDISKMAQKISTLLKDDTLRSSMGDKAKELVKRFDKEIICKRWKTLIDLILQENNQIKLSEELALNFSAQIDDMEIFVKRLNSEHEKNNTAASVPHYSNQSVFESEVLQINDNDLIGNKFNGHDLHLYLREKYIDSKQLVWNKDSRDKNTFEIARDKVNRNEIFDQVNSIQRCYSLDGILNQIGYDILFDPLFLNAELVHLHLIHNKIFDIQLLPLMSRLKPIVWTLHDPWALGGHCIHHFDCNKWETQCGDCPNQKVPFSLQSDNSALNFVLKKDAVKNSQITAIVASKWMKNKIEKSPIWQGKKVYLLPFGIDQSLFKSACSKTAKENLSIAENSTVIMFRSDSGSFKGLDIIKKALLDLKNTKNITLITVGQKGLLKEFHERFNILEYGWIKDDKLLARLYQTCDIFLMPSRQETFGMMAIEAMSSGKMVLALESEGSALSEVINSPVCGLAVSEENFSKELQKLINNPKEVIERGERSLDYAQKNYSKDIFVDGMIRIYEEVMSNHHLDESSKLVLQQLKKDRVLEIETIPSENKSEFKWSSFFEIKFDLLKHHLTLLFLRYKNIVPKKIRIFVKNIINKI